MRHFIDPLESRQMLAATHGSATLGQGTYANGSTYRLDKAPNVVTGFKLSHTGTLFVTGTSHNDNLTVNVRGGKLVGNAYYILAQPASGNFVFASTIVPTGKIRRIVVVGLGGDDKITVNADVEVNVRGSAGNDTISVGAAKASIVGGSGQNSIVRSNVPAYPLIFPKTDITRKDIKTIPLP